MLRRGGKLPCCQSTVNQDGHHVDSYLRAYQAYNYTDLLSCMLLDAYAFLLFTLRELTSFSQLGDTRMYVPVLGIHAHQIPLDTNTGQ